MSDYISDSWGYTPPGPKKKKKKSSTRLTTSFRLPKLDEMVLLQPIATRGDGTPKEERTRVETINEQLERYNRWLAFTQPSKPGKNVRNTAADLQNSVHDLNALIASMMIKIDQKIACIQDSTEAFVEAVQKEGSWQTCGDLLDLTYEELEAILSSHPHRTTDAYKHHLCATVRTSTSPAERRSFIPYAERHLDKLLRLISEVQQCEDGHHEAFHLLVFTKVTLLPQLTDEWSSEFIAMDNDEFDEKVVQLVRKSNAAAVQKPQPHGRVFFDFAAAARETYSKLPRRCYVCHRRAPSVPPGAIPLPMHDPLANMFPPPPAPPPCARAPYLRLLQTVQQWAHGEILSGIMLTFRPRLPRELCLLIFEYAMQAEGLPLNPCVWEDDDYLVGMRIAGAVKARYSCPKPTPSRDRW